MDRLDAPAELSAVCTTVASAQDAQRLAQAVLEQRLAACVQVQAVRSHYRWDGVLQEEGEHRLVCKTQPQAVPGLLGLLRALHPYALPELVVQPLRATQEYAQWVRQETAA